ncbi:hypothetical protein SDRG_12422 [Saprolegnia diclina VS20]|uniref:Thioredoxin domain-containing protein n=1 Tax=Saprolegnia diclina (strain VS20) TaxID=1156394 RepID=T0RCC6_SAPDV|nr:hypothetical protein SDRG_12422 [Saprolegnia diclina VS20]EQC29878.1 hypothetical protein SDRG_12422 [Saprolegnia diclina VS20]|eukprot:XP_008616717.1 hypothetical protein SDRG_12422 [Saprolegnia diclina VS20]
MAGVIVNQDAPDFDLVDLETGAITSFNSITSSGKPSVVMFYATWCNSCVPAVEEFERWSKHNLPTPFVNFVLINVDKHIQNALDFVRAENPKTKKPRVCTEYLDTDDGPTVLHFGCDDIPDGYGVHAVPHKLVIDEHNVVIRNFDDFHWDDIAGLFKHKFELSNQCTWQPLIKQ